jgi:hypothetical protein
MLIQVFYASATVGGEWSSSHHGCFTPGERAPNTNCIEGWVEPRVRLDHIENKNSLPYKNSNWDLSVFQPVASRFTDHAKKETQNEVCKVISLERAD